MPEPIIATWTLQLHTACPNCQEWVDLLDDLDFWDGRCLEPCEHGSKQSKGVEVACPLCGHEFEVDLEY